MDSVLHFAEEAGKKAAALLSANKDIAYAFLFGSALTHLLPQSDVDVLVGGEVGSEERLRLAAELEPVFKRTVDIVPAASADCEVVLKALAAGKPLMIADRKVLKADYFRNLRRYEDGANLRALRRERIKRGYADGG